MALNMSTFHRPAKGFWLLAAAVVAIPVATGCGRSACFQWSPDEFQLEGGCPSQADAINFFTQKGCAGPIINVETEGAYDGQLCCYGVTMEDVDTTFGCGQGGFGGTGEGGFGGGTSVAVGVGGGTGGTGGAPSCITCKSAFEGNPGPLCGFSQALADEITACLCMGACTGVCSANVCAGGSIDGACSQCLSDATSGCGNALANCLNDV